MHYWTSITTTNYPAWQILGHAKHLISQGAYRPIYFLDNPEIYSPNDLNILKRYIRYVICDKLYWRKLKIVPRSLVQKQLINLKVARQICKSSWFLHIDSDEFIHLDIDFNQFASSLPSEISEVRLQNFERVTTHQEQCWHKGVLRKPSWDQEILSYYPKFTRRFLSFGLANYFHGKSFVKSKTNITQSIHGAIRKGEFEVIRLNLPWSSGFIAHYQFSGKKQYYNRIRGMNRRASFMLRHEQIQLEWVAQSDFEKEAIFELADALFFFDETDLQGYLELGLFQNIPTSLIQNFENSFSDADLLFEEYRPKGQASQLEHDNGREGAG